MVDPVGKSAHRRRVQQPPAGAEYMTQRGEIHQDPLQHRKLQRHKLSHPKRLRDGMV